MEALREMAKRDEERKVKEKNKHEFFMQRRSAAREAFEQPAALELQDQDPLLRELRLVFDWMARERNAEKIPSRLFKQRLPDIYRKFPQLGNNFKRMDANSDCWLQWEEFVTYCLQDERLVKTLRRAASMSVYGVSKTGEHAYKDPFDPMRACELGPSPPILPWELSHTIEWRIEGLKPGPPGKPLEHAGMQVRPGTSIASPPFRAAGVTGFLRFWPVGYWTESQRTRKTSEVQGREVKGLEGYLVMGSQVDGMYGLVPDITKDGKPVYRSGNRYLFYVDTMCYWKVGPDYKKDEGWLKGNGSEIANIKVWQTATGPADAPWVDATLVTVNWKKTKEIKASDSEGRCRPPSASSWCSIGACLPSGTHLALRFFVGDATSEHRECYWSEGTHVHQLWGPKGCSPYAAVANRRGDNEAMTLVVGIEIFKNMSEHKNMRTEHRLKSAADVDRTKRRPVLKDPLTQVPVPKGSSLLMSSSSSLPNLKPKSRSTPDCSATLSLPKLPFSGQTQELRHSASSPTGLVQPTRRSVLCA